RASCLPDRASMRAGSRKRRRACGCKSAVRRSDASSLKEKGKAMKELHCKRILVTGGAGFLGSHLCEQLLAQGHDVLCVDNFYTGSKLNICHLLQRPNFELLRHDVTFPLYVEVDEIYNLACPASPVHYQHDPVQTTKTSVH